MNLSKYVPHCFGRPDKMRNVSEDHPSSRQQSVFWRHILIFIIMSEAEAIVPLLKQFIIVVAGLLRRVAVIMRVWASWTDLT